MIGAAYHQDAVIALQAVYLVQEVAPYLVCDHAVQVLEDEIARREFACLGENLLDSELGASKLQYRSYRCQ